MNIVMSLNIALRRCPEEEMIPRLAEAGFDGLDFNFCDLTERIDWHDEDAVDRLIEPWLEAAAACGMTWMQGHGPMFGMFSDAPRDEKARNLSIPSLRVAGKLGVPWMVFHPDTFAGAMDAAHRKAVLNANVAFFQTLLPTCEKHGVGIAIENLRDVGARTGWRKCPRFYGAVPEELCELVDTLDHPLVGVCWDTGHGHVMGHDQHAAIASFGQRLKAVHIQDNDGIQDGHQLPFVTGGGVDWQAVAQGLRAIDYPGPFTFEVAAGIHPIPDPLLDDFLKLAVKSARHIMASTPVAQG